MDIRVLGPLTIDGSGPIGRRDRVVLGSLATRPGHPVSADQLADALWGERPPASWAKILQGCVVRLRKLLGPDAIETSAAGYVLRLPVDQIDSLRFEHQVARARELLTLGEPDRAAYLLTEALSLWSGEPYSDLGQWEPALAQARRLGELRLEAEELRVDAHLRAGRHREVIAEAQALVRGAPLRERRWALLATAQYQAGQQGEALRTIHQLKAVLVRQLGVDPDPELLTLEESILRKDPSLRVPDAPASVSAACPWQGLKPYDVDDADRFFGRDADVAAALATLERTSMLALVGPSGSGKSSILRAGVGASLRFRGRSTLVLTPGSHPAHTWAALDRARPDTVLLVDQLEELFTLCEDPEEQQRFLLRLAETAAHRTVAVALRADRLADVTLLPAISRLVERGLHLVGGLDEEGLRDAVTGPARLAGLVMEPGLVDLLVEEVREDPGALPLLSHALLETWKRRESHTLTVDGYRATGGIRGAVAQSAERLYAGIDAERRGRLRDLMLRLVSPGPDGGPVRAKVPRRQLGTDPESGQLIELLVGARLVTSDDGALEISHEALARAWPRLRGWLDDDLEGQRILHHLSSAADAWDSLGRPASELYRGVRLTRAVDWWEHASVSLTRVESDFLEVSRQAAAVEEQTAVERARAQALLIRRLRLVLGGAAVLLVLAMAAGGLAAVQSDRAGDNAAAAADAATRAIARQAGADALISEDIDESLLLAVAGVSLSDSPQTRNSLLAALGRYPDLVSSTPLAGGSAVIAVAASPDGRTVATLDDLHLVQLYDAATGSSIATHQAGPARTSSAQLDRALEFSPDGRLLAVPATPLLGRPLELLDARTLEPASIRLAGLPRRGWLLTDAAFSADSRHLAVAIARQGGDRDADRDAEVTAAAAMVWDLASPDRPWRHRFRIDELTPESVALSPDGEVLYTGPPLTRLVLATGQRQDLGIAKDLVMSPDGRYLAGTQGFGALLFDGRSGELIRRLEHDNAIDLRFSRDGATLASIGYRTREVRIWALSADRARLRADVRLDPGAAESVDLTADASRLVSASGSRSLRTWDLTGAERFLRRDLSPGSFGGFGTVAPGGDRFVQMTDDGWMFTEVGTGARSPVVPMPDGYRHSVGTWSTDGDRYATAVGRHIDVWDTTTGQRTGGGILPDKELTELDFSPDGTRMAVSAGSGRVTLLDSETMLPTGQPVELGEPVSWVQLRPDNTTAVVLTGGPGGSDVLVRPSTGWALVDLANGTVLRSGAVDMRITTWLAVSPDGRYAAVSGGESTEFAGPSGGKSQLVVIDLTTGDPVRPPVQAHGGAAYQLAYSPDGQRLLTTGLDGTVALWEVPETTLVAKLSLGGSPGRGAGFAPDGRSVRVVEWETGTSYTWPLDPDAAVDFACRAVGRNFTGAEWREHFGDLPQVPLCDT